MRSGLSLAFVSALFLAACGDREEGAKRAPDLPLMKASYIEAGDPPTLREWGQVQLSGGSLVLGEGVMPYDLNTPLFSDYAHKLRTVWMPRGTQARYREGEVLDFPVGTVITKTFYYPVEDGAAEQSVLRETDAEYFAGDRLPLDNIRLIETRVLVHREAGWEAFPYRWNDDQRGAELARIGGIIGMDLTRSDGSSEPFNYVIPNVNECASCHATNSNEDAIRPIGPKVRHLNREFSYDGGARNQIAHWSEAGLIAGAPDDVTTLPMNAAWGDRAAGLAQRARAYLDINCAHCHSPIGPADTSGLSLEPDASGPALGTCKLPIAAGAGTGNRRWGIRPGHPDDSILVYRMEADEGDKMMPEIGRSTVHKEGVALIRQWVEKLDGDCT